MPHPMKVRQVSMNDNLWSGLKNQAAELERELQVRVSASSLVRTACLQWLKRTAARRSAPASVSKI